MEIMSDVSTTKWNRISFYSPMLCDSSLHFSLLFFVQLYSLLWKTEKLLL